jgi:hypothetical protein
MKTMVILLLNLFIMAISAQSHISVGALSETTVSSSIIDSRPQFPGGSQALFEFIQSRIVYPDFALINNIQGNCIVELTVKADGSLSSFGIIKDIGGGCGDESVRVLSLMPNWIPAYRNAIPVDSTMVLPVKFKIEDSPASFPGGTVALQDFINTMFIIPQDIQNKGLHGKVELALFISPEGTITYTETIYNSLEMPSAEKAAKDVIAIMPRWKPQIQGNKKVSSKTFITFQF